MRAQGQESALPQFPKPEPEGGLGGLSPVPQSRPKETVEDGLPGTEAHSTPAVAVDTTTRDEPEILVAGAPAQLTANARDEAQASRPAPADSAESKMQQPVTPLRPGRAISPKEAERRPSRRPPPSKRGGRTRGPLRKPPASLGRSSRLQKPALALLRNVDLTCQKRDGVWQIWLSVGGVGEVDARTLTLWQGQKRLDFVGFGGGSWLLEALDMDLRVEGMGEEPVLLDQKALWSSPLVFRMDGVERAHYVGGKVRTGRFLILVPEDWRVLPLRSARQLAAAEPTHLPSFLVYPVILENGDAVVDCIDPDGRSHALIGGKPMLKLLGPVVEDIHPYKGPLYAPTAPQVLLDRPLGPNRGSRGISTLVIGEEGPVTGKRWKVELDVDTTLPVNLAEKLQSRSGWYFVRAYDSSATLVDSLDFRYFAGPIRQAPSLEELQPPGGHTDGGCRVQIEHPPGTRLTPGDEAATLCRIEAVEVEATTLWIPARPEADRTLWTLHHGMTQSVDLVVGVSRLWWGVGSEQSHPEVWTQQPLHLKLRDLRPSSATVLWLRAESLALKEVTVGTGVKSAHRYRVRGDSLLPIPLRDFSAAWSEAIRAPEPSVHVDLYLWCSDAGDSVLLARCRRLYRCCVCQREFDAADAATNHVSAHLSDQFTQLTYEQARTYLGASLPDKIYECAYCGYLVAAGFPQKNVHNPTDRITRHITEECRKVPAGEGRKQVRFNVMQDTQVIREKLNLNIPDVFQCRRCGKAFEATNRSALLEHLIQRHFDKLVARE